MLVRVSIAAILFALPITKLLAQPPPALAGKSIVVNWSDTRTEKNGAEITTTPAQNFTIKIYIGSNSHIFSLYDRRSGNPRGKVNIDKQVSEAGVNNANGRTAALSWRFERGELDSDQLFIVGARRVSISFTNDMRACEVRIIYGKGKNNANIRYLSRIDGHEVEMLDSKINSTDCHVVDGNILAN